MNSMEESSLTLAGDLCFTATKKTIETSHVLGARVFLSVLNIIFSITAVLGHILVFIAFYKQSSLHPPSKLLFRCLSATDLCFGVITQPAFVVYQLSIVAKRLDICYLAASISYITTTILCGVSLATMTTISVDRLLALLLKMRYRQVVTVKRVRLAVLFVWLQNIAVSMLVFGSSLVYFSLSCAYILLNVVVSTFCYLKIFFTLRLRRSQVRDCPESVRAGEPNEDNADNGGQTCTRYSKTVSSALVFNLILISCYVPYSVIRGMTAIVGTRLLFSEAVVASMVYLRASLNPLFYYWKMKEIRQEVKQMVKQAFCPQR